MPELVRLPGRPLLRPDAVMPWLNAAQAREVTRTRVIMSASAWQHIVVGSVIDAMDGDQDRQVPVNVLR